MKHFAIYADSSPGSSLKIFSGTRCETVDYPKVGEETIERPPGN